MPDDLLAGLRVQLGQGTPDVVKRFGLDGGQHPERLNDKQWRKLNKAIEAWAEKLLAGSRLFPTRAYQQGRTQSMRFLHLLGFTPEEPNPEAERAAVAWLNWTFEHELTGTLDRYKDEVRSAVLYGLREATGPERVASLLYDATKAADRDWRRVAQTEIAAANALGRLDGSRDMGFDEVWIPPHVGACKECKRLIENRVFPIDQLRDARAQNFGKPARLWVPALPQHPWCRHTGVPWVPEVYQEAQDEYARMREFDLDDDTLNEMFDSSGQLRPQYEHDERLVGFFAGKAMRDPYEHLLGETIGKIRGRGITVSKGFFDAPHASLDPLIWEDEKLKPGVHQAIVDFWAGVLGDGWQAWARVFITGSATSYQWGTGWNHPWLGSHQQQTFPDVDTHLVIDYHAVRDARPMWAGMSPMELRKLIEAWAVKAKQDVELAPGMRLDAYVRLEQTPEEFDRDVRQTGQGVYDVLADAWMIPPTNPSADETYGKRILAGLGGRLANEHPDWITYADSASAELQRLLDAYRAHPGVATLRALQSYMDVLYADRTQAFLVGAGQEDRGNWTWQYLENYGPLLDVKELLHSVG